MIKTLLAIPVYNCEKQIIRVLKSIYPHQELFDQIILFENKSTDNTLLNIKNFLNEFKFQNLNIFQNNNNINLGGSHINIFDYFISSNCNKLLIIHGDDQADINDFIKNRNNIKNFDWVKFSRFHPKSRLIGYSIVKKIGNIFFNILFSLVLRKKIFDIGSGLDFYDKNFISKVPYFNFPLNLTFDYYMLLYGASKKKINFFPQSWKEEDQISNVRLFKQSIELLNIFFEFSFKLIFKKSEKFFSIKRHSYDKEFFKNKQINLDDIN